MLISALAVLVGVVGLGAGVLLVSQAGSEFGYRTGMSGRAGEVTQVDCARVSPQPGRRGTREVCRGLFHELSGGGTVDVRVLGATVGLPPTARQPAMLHGQDPDGGMAVAEVRSAAAVGGSVAELLLAAGVFELGLTGIGAGTVWAGRNLRGRPGPTPAWLRRTVLWTLLGWLVAAALTGVFAVVV